MAERSPRRVRLPRSKRRSRPGASPGTIAVHEDALPSRIDVIAFGADAVDTHDDIGLEEIEELRGKRPVIWINVTGLGSEDVIRGLGTLFGLHDLALEDVVNIHQRAKVEDYDQTVFIVATMPIPGPHPKNEQLSMFLGADFLITFQQTAGDCFEAVRERLRNGRGRIRGEGPDYLAYALIDATIDAYFAPVEKYGELVEELELMAVETPTREVVGRIHEARRDLFLLRKTMWGLREMVAALSRDSVSFFSDRTRLYLRDCHDHAIQLLDMIETYRDFATNLFELYLSTISNRMNEIMKVLTIIATIFIPLSFITGVYGMNFNTQISRWNMPELNWAFGYPFALGLMAAVAIAMLFMFWKRKWIGRG